MKADILSQFLRFGAVGLVGFVVDGGLLWLLLTQGADTYIARLVSFPVAVVVTWWLNRMWTFSDASRDKPARQFNKYLMVQITGAVANFVVYALTFQALGETTLVAMIGFTLGSALGMFVNFAGSRHIAFSEK